MLAIKVKGSYTVRPCDPTWTGTMALSEWDQIGCVTHVPAIYLYRCPQNSANNIAIVETLKESLSKVLVSFYPLAGRLQWIGNGRLQLQCNAMGARFIEAECESSLIDIGGGDDLSVFSQHRNLFPSADYGLPIHELPLFLVQLTTFRCGGFGIGIALSHAVADGPAALHFMSEWARITRGDTLQTPPFLNRNVFRAGEPPSASPPTLDDYPEYGTPALLLGQSDTLEERKKKTTTAMMKLTKSQVEKLRKMANDSREKPMARGFTRYEAICGHVWRITCKARGHRKEQPTAMGICVDSRSRMSPEVPREYFGTATFDVIAQSVAGDLMSKPLGFAAGKVREAIEKVTDKYIRSLIEFLKNQKDLREFQDIHTLLGKEEGPFYGNPNITVVSWMTLGLYGFDFGWGKEQYMGPGPYEEDGSVLLMHSPDGDGSVVVAMCLQEAHMDEFKKYFYQDTV